MQSAAKETINNALGQFAIGVDCELELDVDARKATKLTDADAVVIAGKATDAYLASCSTLMGSVSMLSGDKKLHELIVANIAFMMGRIEKLQVLLSRKGSISKHISFTADQLKIQRERARLSQPTDSNEKKRTMVAKEILSTEHSYIIAIQSLIQHYISPLTKGMVPAVSSLEKTNMFGNIEEILGLAQTFSKALEMKLNNWGPSQTLGDTFKSHAMFFKIYVIYTNGYQGGVKKALKLFKENPDAALVQKNASQAGCQDIGSLMIVPIQRLPRYVLLLKELRKRTPDTHPDARLLEGALADIQVVADHVNERLRCHEDNARILEIQSALWTTRLGGVPVTLLAPGRKLVKEGKLLKVRSIGTLREVQVFLFSDIFLYCTSSSLLPGRYHYHNHLEFYGAGPGAGEAVERGASTGNLDQAFKITSEQIVRVFIAESVAERDEWVQAINQCAAEKKELDSRRNSKRLSSGSVQSMLNNRG